MGYGIRSIGVRNFRSLKELPPIEIKPITLLVGKNSCGKSSFLRLFPFLKQSLEKNIDGPFAFFGEYVDFGDFDTVLNRLNSAKSIGFTINGDISKAPFLYPSSEKKEPIQYEVNLEFKKRKDGSVFAQKIDILIGRDISIEFDVEESKYIKSIKINGKKLSIKKKLIAEHHPNLRSIIPFIIEEGSPFNRWGGTQLDLNEFLAPIYEDVKKRDFVKEKLQDCDILKHDSLAKLEKICSRIDKDNKKILLESLIYLHIPEILFSINREIFRSVENCNYAKPIRANTERYYRFQSERADTVSPDGSNLYQILANLSAKERKDFDDWMTRHFNFTVSINVNLFGSLMVKLPNGIVQNIIDMGYGYTQILPIIVQLWLSIKKKRLSVNPHDVIFAIEQPELHLHPGFQKMMLKAFCTTIKLLEKSELKMRFILETHSKVFVTALADCIENGDISPEKVSVLVFDNDNGSETTVNQSYFNEDGDLENWPIGFFN